MGIDSREVKALLTGQEEKKKEERKLKKFKKQQESEKLEENKYWVRGPRLLELPVEVSVNGPLGSSIALNSFLYLDYRALLWIGARSRSE